MAVIEKYVDYDTMIDIVHSLGVRLNELTEQHVQDVQMLEARIARLEAAHEPGVIIGTPPHDLTAIAWKDYVGL